MSQGTNISQKEEEANIFQQGQRPIFHVEGSGGLEVYMVKVEGLGGLEAYMVKVHFLDFQVQPPRASQVICQVSNSNSPV